VALLVKEEVSEAKVEVEGKANDMEEN